MKLANALQICRFRALAKNHKDLVITKIMDAKNPDGTRIKGFHWHCNGCGANGQVDFTVDGYTEEVLSYEVCDSTLWFHPHGGQMRLEL